MKYGWLVFHSTFQVYFFHKSLIYWLARRQRKETLWIRADLAEVYGGALMASRLNPSLPSWRASCEVLRDQGEMRGSAGCNLALNRSPVRDGEWWYITPITPLKAPAVTSVGSSSQGEIGRASREHQIEVSRVQHTQYISHWAIGWPAA